ncbi:putative integral membrane protein [Paramyrothecium foliicola]|nr:putative integral membrane protein [Paramyrothecium foliicola]
MRPSLLLLPVAALPALGAYVQHKNCDGFEPDHPAWAWEYLSVRLEPGKSSSRAILHAQISLGSINCEKVPNITAVEISTVLPWESASSEIAVDASCQPSRRIDAGGSETVMNPWDRTHMFVTKELDKLYPLSSLQLDFRLKGPDSETVACISSNITPGIKAPTSGLLQYLPWAVLITVLLSSYFQYYFGDQGVLRIDAESMSDTRRRRPSLEAVGGCIQLLHFVFLTGSLSLRYPGFYQPAVSFLNWFSLFSSSNAFMGGQHYNGTYDGIYVINGTYGGTYGMELMTQHLGAPMTMETWYNMLVLLAIIVGLVALFCCIHHMLMPKIPQPEESEEGEQKPFNIRKLLVQVLHVTFSYFLLPIIALSAYQIDHVGIFPASYISMSSIFIVIIVACFCWLFMQLPTRNLGIFVLGNSKRYEMLPAEDAKHELMALVHFTLVFIRGLAIGGLQISAIAQVGVLIFCELGFLAALTILRTHAWLSSTVVCALGRLCTIVLMIGFIPRLEVSLSSKSILGYTSLVLQGILLICGILVPSLFRLARLCVPSTEEDRPPVYNLRQLRVRQQPSPELPERPDSSIRQSVNFDACRTIRIVPTARAGTPSTLRLDIKSQASIRTPSIATSRMVSPSSKLVSSPSSGTSDESSRSESTDAHLIRPPANESPSPETHSTRARSSETGSSIDRFIGTPGVDYSIREADQYYTSNRRLNWGTDSGSFGEGGPQAEMRGQASWYKHVLNAVGLQ